MKRTTTSLPVFSGVVFALAAAVSWSGCDGGSKTAGTNEEPTPCRLNSECDRAYVCSDGLCLPECQEDRDCDGDEVCWWPDYGCLPPGEEPPQATPPRDVVFDPIEGAGDAVDVAFDGCDLDSDCDVGSECVDNKCVEVASGDSCSWSPGPMQYARIMEIGGPIRLAYGDSPSTLCLTKGPDIFTQPSGPVILHTARYANGHLESRSVEIDPDIPGDSSWHCIAVSGASTNPIAVVRLREDVVSYEVSSTPAIVSSTTVPVSSTVAYEPIRGKLIPTNSSDAYLLLFSMRDRAWVGEGGVVDWDVVADESGRHPSVAFHQNDLVMTHTGIHGVVVNGSPIEIDPSLSGLAIHHQGDGVYGWFAADDSGALYYGQGGVGGAWTADSMDITVGAMLQYTGSASYYFTLDVATNPATGEILIVFLDLATGEVRAITRDDSNWIVWDTGLGQLRPVSLRARWVGCGRPAVELIGVASDRGWFVAEAR